MIKMIVLILSSILVGLAAGRRLGLIQGFQAGMAYGLLDARRQSLETGCCPICDSLHLVTGSDPDQEAAGTLETYTPDPRHDGSRGPGSEGGAAEAEYGEFGTVIAGCCRQVLNLLMGAFSMPWKYTTEFIKEAWRRLILHSLPKVREQLAWLGRRFDANC